MFPKDKKIVGYRYGKAPECGRSFNYRENQYECGVSMAQIGYYKEVGSFAVSDADSREKYYYEGVICGEGGDDEVCLSNVRQITFREYMQLRKVYKDVSNEYVNYVFDRKQNLLNKGYNICMTQEEINKQRKLYIR